ncbi:hypothetical protein NDU88_007271 [Pleurodeles waltl]|uniref:Uncharacterized protein n=1 Tax=Pleurodeles waltl TaxID=8319 RepID=A0AAV7LT43_PLEWA|nr:hypothetical protein NDU88_007271 [Pleurodeles waltl]
MARGENPHPRLPIIQADARGGRGHKHTRIRRGKATAAFPSLKRPGSQSDARRRDEEILTLASLSFKPSPMGAGGTNKRPPDGKKNKQLQQAAVYREREKKLYTGAEPQPKKHSAPTCHCALQDVCTNKPQGASHAPLRCRSPHRGNPLRQLVALATARTLTSDVCSRALELPRPRHLEQPEIRLGHLDKPAHDGTHKAAAPAGAAERHGNSSRWCTLTGECTRRPTHWISHFVANLLCGELGHNWLWARTVMTLGHLSLVTGLVGTFPSPFY